MTSFSTKNIACSRLWIWLKHLVLQLPPVKFKEFHMDTATNNITHYPKKPKMLLTHTESTTLHRNGNTVDLKSLWERSLLLRLPIQDISLRRLADANGQMQGKTSGYVTICQAVRFWSKNLLMYLTSSFTSKLSKSWTQTNAGMINSNQCPVH